MRRDRISAAHAVAALAAAVLLASCDDLEYASVWKDTCAMALTKDAEDYQGEVNLTDYGVVVFSYAYRAGSHPLEELKQQIIEAYPCYQVVAASRLRLVLRCRDEKRWQRDHERTWPPYYRYGQYREEFDFLVDEANGRVFVLAMARVPEPGRHDELVGALDDAQRGYEPRAPKRPTSSPQPGSN